jgi:hypothetical protein
MTSESRLDRTRSINLRFSSRPMIFETAVRAELAVAVSARPRALTHASLGSRQFHGSAARGGSVIYAPSTTWASPIGVIAGKFLITVWWM